MLELFKKKKKLPNQDRQIPQTIQELIKRYDLDNTDIIKYLEYLVPLIVSKNGDSINGDIILENAHYLKGEDANNNLIRLIRASNNMTAIGDYTKETRIWSSVKPTIDMGGTIYTIATTDDVNAKTVRTAGADLNDYTETGTYFFYSSANPANRPSLATINAGYLEVTQRTPDDILQKWFTYNRNEIFVRQRTSGTWQNWFKLGEEKNYITVYPSADKKLTADGSFLWAMDTKQYSAGSKLSINSNGEVVIGKGVNHVRVSGQVYYYTGTNGSKSVQISSNGIQIRSGYNVVNYSYISIPAKDFPVSENQTIGLYVNGKANDLFKAYSLGSFMTVEVID